ncbi:MAG TPA: hypothetical protein VMU59_08590 [Caulobacteraceae bacterium]|nr:hypothetical protein [Caulobacteraceae bacterium]
MARDEGLEELLREDLQGEPDLSEMTMFGGRAWLLHGNLLCGARHDGMLARLGKDNVDWALASPDVEPMRAGPRLMPGWVWLKAEACGDDALRRKLLDAALAMVRQLPPK